MASIFILFPKENKEHTCTALQHFQWAMERFETMAERNRLAAAARGVLNAIHARLKKSLGVTCLNGRSPLPTCLPGAADTSQSRSPAPNGGAQMASPFATASGSSTGPSTTYTPGGSSTSGSGSGSGPGGPFGPLTAASEGTPIDPGLSGVAASDWGLPEGFDWGSIQPVYAMADVAYNDLMGISTGATRGENTASSAPNWAGGAPLLNDVPGSGGDSQPWLFGGDFGNDSVWNLLNQYPSPF